MFFAVIAIIDTFSGNETLAKSKLEKKSRNRMVKDQFSQVEDSIRREGGMEIL